MSVQYSSAGCFLLVMLMALVISTVDVASAKRGCASFGHSCFGGHGKRSSPDTDTDTLSLPSEDYFSPPKSEDYPSGNKIPRSSDYPVNDMTLDRPSGRTQWTRVRLPTTTDDWIGHQQLLASAADLSPILRQIVRSYYRQQLHPINRVAK
uniref:Neuropeptide CCHamide-2 n=1 Tax=Cacopsylla melanoneura TaxID=428564 RepID=A0A8D8VZK4_9HEMI